MMQKSAKAARAEKQFARLQKKKEVALKDKEKEDIKRDEQMANLKALRLAKEAADKEEAAKK
ncbi:MAG: hypothetical protein ACO3MW_08115 [Rhodospirillales bacterium]